MNKNTEKLTEKYKKLFQEALEELKTPGKKHRQIPNILTSLRLLAPFFIIPASLVGNAPLAVSLGIVFGLTDLADGYIARKWNLTSELGADLDAITDKVFVGTLLVSGAFTNPALIVNIISEGIIALINTHQKKKGFSPSTVKVGKVKTWFLFALAISGVVSSLIDIELLVNSLLVTTAVFQGFTIGAYLNQYKNNDIKYNKNQSDDIKIEEIDIVEDFIEKEQNKIKDYLLSNKQTTSNVHQDDVSKEEILDELKNMSDFLHQEQENLRSSSNINQKTEPIQLKKK